MGVGCTADRDGDGVCDAEDRCPDEAESPDQGGCPDRDGDGVLDDACPKQAGPAATKGCPHRDKDSIADKDDNCLNVFGKAEFQGCLPPKTVKLTAEKIEILEVILFETGKTKIRRESFGLLNDVATVLKGNPHLKKVRIEGHTDNVGKPDRDMKLSQGRAEAIRTYLIEKCGIDSDRLVAQGFCQERSVAVNNTPKGRTKNRRVEFVVIEQ